MKTETKKFLSKLVTDAFLLAGCALLSFGAWLAWPPAGAIVSGALLLTAGVVRNRAGA